MFVVAVVATQNAFSLLRALQRTEYNKMSVIPRSLINSLGRRTLSATFFSSSRNYSVDNGGFFKSSYPDVEIPRIHVTEFILNDAAKWHNKVAVECGFTGRKYTYDDLRIKSRNLNRAFRKKLKLQRGDVVALLLPNIPEFPICVFGTFLAGLKLTTLNPTYTPDEVKRQLQDSNAKILITLTGFWNNAKKAVGLLNRDIPILTIKHEKSDSTPQGGINFEELIESKIDIPDPELPSPDETIFLPYSSGTTGLPKGVEISSDNLVSNLVQVDSPDFKVTVTTTDTHQDVLPAVLPLFHIYGFTVTALAFFKIGAKIITLPKFTPESYLNTIINHKPNLLMVVPPIVIFLNTHPDVKPEHLRCLRGITCGAAPLGALDEEKFRQKVGKSIYVAQGYGLSETSPVVTFVPADKEGKYAGSTGTPVPNTYVKVVDVNDPELKHLGPHKKGELLIKGPQVMKGYHNRPEESKNAFVNGWFRTGDMVYYDKDNMFYVADRIKELIKVKGLQVAPAELEEVIRDFPGVADAAVIGIPHQISGEVPRAYVVPKKGSVVDTDKLCDYVQSKLSRHKHLAGGVVVLDSIPKNASGKIMRRQLKLQYEEKGI